MLPVAIPVCLCGDCYLRPDLGASRYHPGLCVAPERDNRLAPHGHKGDPPWAPAKGAAAPGNPPRHPAAGLVARQDPGELDHSRPSPGFSSRVVPPIAIHTAALIGHWCDADV